MMQIELTYISIKCVVVNPYVDGFFNCSGNAMVLPPYYLEVVLCDYVASGAAVIDNVLSASGLTMVSKKGMAPSSLFSSTVNLVLGQHY